MVAVVVVPGNTTVEVVVSAGRVWVAVGAGKVEVEMTVTILPDWVVVQGAAGTVIVVAADAPVAVMVAVESWRLIKEEQNEVAFSAISTASQVAT